MKVLPSVFLAMAGAMGVTLPVPYERAIQYSFCGECPMLSVKEREQKRGEKHYCQKYNKQVFHMGMHPDIVRVPECDEPEPIKSEPIPYEVYKDFEQGQPFKDEQ